MSTRDIARTIKELPKHVGPNLSRIEGWRERLLKAAEGLTFRQIADRTGGGGTKRLSHTTVRSVMIGDTAGVQIDTLASMCDALGADMAQILGGPASIKATLPPGSHMLGSPPVHVVPIVPLPLAHEWQQRSKEIDAKSEQLFLGADGEGMRAARATDDSMAPTIRKGDVVIFADDKPESGDLVLVEPEGQGHTLCRRWRAVKDPAKVKLEADNEDYGSVTMAVAKAKVVGVVHRLHRHLT